MFRSKSPLLPRSHPQNHESLGNLLAFPRSAKIPASLAPTSLHPSATTSPLDTPDRPQPQSPQWFAHSFRHTGGVPLLCSIFGFPILTVAPTKLSVSLLFTALTRCVTPNPFVCHSYTRHRGVGYTPRTPVYFSSGSLSKDIFRPVPRPVARDLWATSPCVTLPRPGVPRGAA